MKSERDRRVALFVGYGTDECREDRPDTLGRIQVLAANEMLRRDEIDTAVFVTGADRFQRPHAYPMATQLYRNSSRLPEGSAIVDPKGRNLTDTEIEQFVHIARERGFQPSNLKVVGADTHTQRIEALLAEIAGHKAAAKIDVVGTESYLTSLPNTHRYDSMIGTIRSSDGEQSFKDREAFIMKIRQWPFGTGKFILRAMAEMGPIRYKLGNIAGRIAKT